MDILSFSHVRNFAVAGLASIALAGCFDTPPNTGPVQTVDWYKSHDDKRQAILETCANNPGELSEDSNCINAREAEHLLSSGEPRSIW